MKRTSIYVIGFLLLLSAGLLDKVGAHQETNNDSNKVDASIRRLISNVDTERISKHLFYLAKDPLPYRELNLTLLGHEKNTLCEADDYLAGKLEAWGYRIEREGVRVQAFRRDTSKPKHAQYSPPKPEGKHLAELMAEVNSRYSIGLEQRTAERPRPGDDDGSFVLAGYPAAVINIGSFPYGDPNYHAEGDIPETCDIENAAMTVKATLAAVVTLDRDF